MVPSFSSDDAGLKEETSSLLLKYSLDRLSSTPKNEAKMKETSGMANEKLVERSSNKRFLLDDQDADQL